MAVRDLTAEVIDAHLRSLQPGHLVDVQSTDQHTVNHVVQRQGGFRGALRASSTKDFPCKAGGWM